MFKALYIPTGAFSYIVGTSLWIFQVCTDHRNKTEYRPNNNRRNNTIQYRRYHVCLIRQDSEVVFSKSSPQFFLTSSWEEVLLAKITEDSCVSKSGVDRNCNTIISVNQFSNSCIMLTFCLFFIQLLVCSVCDWFYLVVQFWSSICLILSRIHYTFMFKDCKLLSVAFLVGQSRRD